MMAAGLGKTVVDSSLHVSPYMNKQAQELAGSTAGWEDEPDWGVGADFAAVEPLVELKQGRWNKDILYSDKCFIT